MINAKKQRKIIVMRYKNLKNNQSNHPQINKKVIINQNYKNPYTKAAIFKTMQLYKTYKSNKSQSTKKLHPRSQNPL